MLRERGRGTLQRCVKPCLVMLVGSRTSEISEAGKSCERIYIIESEESERVKRERESVSC